MITFFETSSQDILENHPNFFYPRSRFFKFKNEPTGDVLGLLGLEIYRYKVCIISFTLFEQFRNLSYKMTKAIFRKVIDFPFTQNFDRWLAWTKEHSVGTLFGASKKLGIHPLASTQADIKWFYRERSL